MPPSVLIDFERLKHLNSGLGRFSLRLGEEMATRTGPHWRAVYLVPGGFEGRFGTRVEYETASWLRRAFPAFGPRHDLWHATHQESRYRPKSRGTRYLLSIHDLNFLEEKTPVKAGRRLRKLQQKVDRASGLTFVSEYTQQQARRHLELPPVPQEVIPNGADVDPGIEPRRPAWAPTGEYLLAVGLVRPRKNFHVLVDLVARLPDVSLVVAGNTDHPYAGRVREVARREGVEGRVLLPGEVAPEEKVWLLENCAAFTFPSMLEGFGLPVVEAMARGKPVFCANRTSLPEVAGPDAAYWTTFDADDMAAVFRREMGKFRADPSRSERLRQRAARFTWSEAASKYARLYSQLLDLGG